MNDQAFNLLKGFFWENCCLYEEYMSSLKETPLLESMLQDLILEIEVHFERTSFYSRERDLDETERNKSVYAHLLKFVSLLN